MTIIAVSDDRDELDLISDLIYDADPDSEILEFEFISQSDLCQRR